MTIYVLNFNDNDCYCAYKTFEKAKQILWENYCDEIDLETRNKYLKEDLETLKKGYIIDYAYIKEVTLVEE